MGEAMKASELKALLTATIRLRVVQSKIAGRGVLAMAPIKQGQIIGFYEGRRFKSHEDREAKGQLDCSYIFGLSNGELIDGTHRLLGKVNHSCDPCTTVLEAVIGGRAEIVFVAKRDIAKGEELTLDYHYAVEGKVKASQYVCRCGAWNCSGSLLKRPKAA